MIKYLRDCREDAAKELTPSITFRVNKSLNDGTVPALWKVEFQTRKRNGGKEQLTIGTLVTGQLFRIF